MIAQEKVLLEAPLNLHRRNENSILLTIDLTKAVAEEAIRKKASIIIAYHPIIFRGLKSLTLANSQQATLLRLAAEGISVYCPHTAVDTAPWGLNKWLSDIITGTLTCDAPASSNSDTKATVSSRTGSASYTFHPFPTTYDRPLSSETAGAKRFSTRPIVPFAPPASFTPKSPYQIGDYGAGLLVNFLEKQQLTTIVHRISSCLGRPKGFHLAIPQGAKLDDILISNVGICAGSGASVFASIRETDKVDLLFTGEMSHHDALAAIEKGQCVIALGHSNSERGFLDQSLSKQLSLSVLQAWAKARQDRKQDDNTGSTLHGDVAKAVEDVFEDSKVDVEISVADRDPYGLVLYDS